MEVDDGMKPLVERNARQQKVGGFAALYLAAAYVAAMPYFLVFVKYRSAVSPADKVAVLVGNTTACSTCI